MTNSRAVRRIGVVTAALAVAVSATLFAAPQAASARTLSVSPGQSIQAAINAASNGDTVEVAPGTYRESLTISKYITLHGANRATTILRNPGGAAEVIFVINVPFSPVYKTVISGFSIADGNAPGGHGGGMTLYNADAEVTDNVFDSNHAQVYGGAIASIGGSDPVIHGNVFQRNTAVDGGGAVFAAQDSGPTIADNIFSANTATGWSTPGGGSTGGAIYVATDRGHSVFPVIINNTISGNTADFAGGGIMLLAGTNAIVEGNTISGNRAAYGAGIHAETYGSSVSIMNNTITDNIAPESPSLGGGYGGGIAIFAQTSAGISENTLRGNRASRGGGGIVVAEGSTATIDSNTLRANGVGSAGQTSSADGGGIHIVGATATLTSNVITDCDANQGGAIGVLNGGVANIVNNTLAFNVERAAPGGAVFFVGSAGRGYVTNNILYSNTRSQIWEERVAAVKRNNLIEPGQGDRAATTGGTASVTAADLNRNGPSLAAADNFSGDPQFTDASGRDLSLKPSSPARDRSTTTDAPGYPKDDRRNVLRATGVDDVGAYEYEANPLQKTHVWRFWSESKHSHFYTSFASERDQVATNYAPAEWRYEGIAYDAFSTQVPGTVPLYRFYSSRFGGHFYTASQSEKDYVAANYPKDVWNYEAIAYYVWTGDYTGDAQTVWRFWSPDNRHHFYTASDYERDVVRATYPSNVWSYEGSAYKVPR